MRDQCLVTLVRPPILCTIRAFNNEATPCIGFAYISSYLRSKGYDVHIVDGIAEALNRYWEPPEFPGYHCQGLTIDEILDRIDPRTRIFGFSAMFSGEWPITRAAIKAVRRRFLDALVVAGGEHITALTEYSLRECPEIDVCVRGEGERAMHELCEAHLADRSFAEVGGVAYLDSDGAFVETEPARIREIDDIPWPIWPEGYMERFWEAGKSYGVQTARDMPILASRGCPYRCTFCSNPQMWTTRYILRGVDDLIAEIKSYTKRYDVTALQFYDLTAITKKRWTMEFCRKLIEEKLDYLKWSLPSGTRSEALDADTLGMLKRTNCNYLVYAPESGSPDTLEKIKKRIDLGKLTELGDRGEASRYHYTHQSHHRLSARDAAAHIRDDSLRPLSCLERRRRGHYQHFLAVSRDGDLRRPSRQGTPNVVGRVFLVAHLAQQRLHLDQSADGERQNGAARTGAVPHRLHVDELYHRLSALSIAHLANHSQHLDLGRGIGNSVRASGKGRASQDHHSRLAAPRQRVRGCTPFHSVGDGSRPYHGHFRSWARFPGWSRSAILDRR